MSEQEMRALIHDEMTEGLTSQTLNVWYFEVLLLVLGSGLIEVIVFAPELPGLFPHGQVKRGVQWKWCESPTAYLHRNSLVIRAIDSRPPGLARVLARPCAPKINR